MIDGWFHGSFDGVHAITARLETLNYFASDLVERWADVLAEDNRRGVLMGTDKDDRPVMPTSYRRSFTQSVRGRAGQVDEVKGRLVNFNSGVGPGFKPGAGWNLTTKEYQEQSGPPLAPFGEASRIISNYLIKEVQNGVTIGVEGGWDDVVNAKGVEFLPFHFAGTGMHKGGAYATFAKRKGVGRGKNLPRRNMAGLRAWGRAQSRKELREWIKSLMTAYQPAYWMQQGHVPEFLPGRKFKPRKPRNGGPPSA